MFSNLFLTSICLGILSISSMSAQVLAHSSSSHHSSYTIIEEPVDETDIYAIPLDNDEYDDDIVLEDLEELDESDETPN